MRGERPTADGDVCRQRDAALRLLSARRLCRLLMHVHGGVTSSLLRRRCHRCRHQHAAEAWRLSIVHLSLTQSRCLPTADQAGAKRPSPSPSPLLILALLLCLLLLLLCPPFHALLAASDRVALQLMPDAAAALTCHLAARAGLPLTSPSSSSAAAVCAVRRRLPLPG